MTSQRYASPVNRRAVLEGMGVGALGLAGAALLGCGNSASKGGSGSGPAGGVEGATSGGGLPKTAPAVQGKIRDGGTYAMASTSTTRQFDGHTALGGSASFRSVQERALEPDPDTGAIRPNIVTSWEAVDPSGLTLVLKIHPKVFVHNMSPWNGRQFAAADLAWNLERIGGLYAERLKIPPSSFQRATMVQNIVKAEAIDPLTVKVTLSKPNSAFFNGLMENRTPMMPKEMDDIGFKDPLKVGGTGAFQVAEWVTDQYTAFKKNPLYGQFRPGEPHFDEFRDIVIPDAAATQAAFISGQTHVLSVPTPDSIATVRKVKPEANFYAWVDGNWDYLRPSLDFGPFKDLRVRKGIHLAIDYGAINDGFYGPGWAYQAALSPGYPEAWRPEKVKTLPGYNPDTKASDRSEGAKLLSAAGYANGKGIDFGILYNGSSDYVVAHTTRFQSQMGTVFPEMKVGLGPVPDSATFAVPLAEGRFQMIGYTNTVVPDPVLEATSQYHSKGSRNYGHGNFPVLDALVEKALNELNKDARTKLLDEFQQRYMDEWVPSYVLSARPVRYMLQSSIGGWDKLVGYWFQYSSHAQAGRWYHVDK